MNETTVQFFVLYYTIQYKTRKSATTTTIEVNNSANNKRNNINKLYKNVPNHGNYYDCKFQVEQNVSEKMV